MYFQSGRSQADQGDVSITRFVLEASRKSYRLAGECDIRVARWAGVQSEDVKSMNHNNTAGLLNVCRALGENTRLQSAHTSRPWQAIRPSHSPRRLLFIREIETSSNLIAGGAISRHLIYRSPCPTSVKNVDGSRPTCAGTFGIHDQGETCLCMAILQCARSFKGKNAS